MEQRALLLEVGERLIRLRSQAGLTIEAAAARADVAAERLEQAESGASALTEAELAQLATAYGVDTTEIFGGRITPLQNYAGG
jgi:transcriptional regulator with XRE-family HTH domain